MKVGEYILEDGEVLLNKGKQSVTIVVKNTDERPIQVGSHFHFYETNKKLSFEREKACGYRLDIPAGTAVRFEPSETKTVNLVAIGGKRCIYGANGLVNGSLDDNKVQATKKLKEFCKEGQ